ERQRARGQPGVAGAHWRGGVALRPGGGQEQRRDEQRVEPERLVEEEELRKETEQRSERDRGKRASFEHGGQRAGGACARHRARETSELAVAQVRRRRHERRVLSGR